MRKHVSRPLVLTAMFVSTTLLGSWSGGPTNVKNDSLAIVRVVKPVNEKFNIKPAVFVSKGLGKISQVEMSDIPKVNSEMALKKTISNFLSNGYTLENSTELMQNGVLMNTFYFKKKLI